MTLLVDAGPIVASTDLGDARRRTVQRLLVDAPGPLVIPAPVTAAVLRPYPRLNARARRCGCVPTAEGRFHRLHQTRDDESLDVPIAVG